MLRILHTSDWHLGHSLHGFSREEEQRGFLSWLLDTLEREAVDALLIAGDVFDSSNPPALAQQQWYRFLADTQVRRPQLQTIVIGGNHDSAARLDAPRPLLEAFGATIVGSLPHDESGEIDVSRLLVPVQDAEGEIRAIVAAVPFLRPADLPRCTDEDPLVAGVRRVYELALAAAADACGPERALVAMGHCYMVEGCASELSERRILGGNQQALPTSIFPVNVSYCALGHLHRRQQIRGHPHCHYSGSPLPLAMPERHYEHAVNLVEFEGPEVVGLRALRVPRTTALLRVPDTKAGSIEEVVASLSRLPAQTDERPAPFLEVVVRLREPEPRLRVIIDAALDGRAARLARIGVVYAEHQQQEGAGGEAALATLDPEEVVGRRHWEVYGEAPPAPLMATFRELLANLDNPA